MSRTKMYLLPTTASHTQTHGATMKNIIIVLILLFAVGEGAKAQKVQKGSGAFEIGKSGAFTVLLDSTKTLLVDSTKVKMIVLGKDTVWRKSPDLPKLSGLWTRGDTGTIRRFYSLPQTYFFNFPGFSNPAGARTVVGKDTTTKLAPYSAVVVFTLLQAWDEYLVWCADSVRKRGLDSWSVDTTSYKLDDKGKKVFYFLKAEPTFYREPRERYPSFNEFIEWLRQRVKG